MKVRLDTHAVIWWVDQDHLLGAAARASITDPVNEVFLSAATIWEIAIKVGLGKLSLSMPYRQWMNQAMIDLVVEDPVAGPPTSTVHALREPP